MRCNKGIYYIDGAQGTNATLGGSFVDITDSDMQEIRFAPRVIWFILVVLSHAYKRKYKRKASLSTLLAALESMQTYYDAEQERQKELQCKVCPSRENYEKLCEKWVTGTSWKSGKQTKEVHVGRQAAVTKTKAKRPVSRRARS